MVDGLRSRFGFCIELIADIIEQSRFIHLQQGPRRACQPPPCKVQQIVSISTQGAERKLAQALGIEKGIGPRNFPPLVVEATIQAFRPALSRRWARRREACWPAWLGSWSKAI